MSNAKLQIKIYNNLFIYLNIYLLIGPLSFAYFRWAGSSFGRALSSHDSGEEFESPPVHQINYKL